jgi:hypothetical protein
MARHICCGGLFRVWGQGWSDTSMSLSPRERGPNVARGRPSLSGIRRSKANRICAPLRRRSRQIALFRSLLLQTPQFARPIDQSAAKPVKVGIAGANLGFDCFDLSLGAGNSLGIVHGRRHSLNLPSSAPQRSPRTCARRRRASPACRSAFASAERSRQRTSDPVPGRSRRAR